MTKNIQTINSLRRSLLVGSTFLVASEATGLTHSTKPNARLKAEPEAGHGSLVDPSPLSGFPTLESWIVDGVRVFHLIAQEVDHEFAPGLRCTCWGYNGSTPGPIIEATEGETIRVYVTNRLPAPTSVHWHGILLPNGMDGIAGLNQPAIQPGETFRYEFPLTQSGTALYHAHHDEMTQIAMGLAGMIVIHPKGGYREEVKRDYPLLLQEWRVDPDTSRPNPFEMIDFNILTINGKVYPATSPVIAVTGERVRLRIGNIGPMDHHSMHLHGHSFTVVATDGGEVPISARRPETTEIVPVGAIRTVEFVAERPGDWAFHCHMTHHVMNQMTHGIPSVVGMRSRRLDYEAQSLLPGYKTQGRAGMIHEADRDHDMSHQHHKDSKQHHHSKHDHSGQHGGVHNTLPMHGSEAAHGLLTMGGMFTVVKIRDASSSLSSSAKEADKGDTPWDGWYKQPPGTGAGKATEEELRRDGIGTTGNSAH